MSNHHASYMLNEILNMTELQSVFQTIGKEKTQSLVLHLLQISDTYDCNRGEILAEIGEQLGICPHCSQPANQFQEGVCQNCYDTDFYPTLANEY